MQPSEPGPLDTDQERRSEIVIKTILARHSVREGLRAKPIPRSVLERIVACGIAAPSSKNARPWRLHVVSEPETLREIADVVECAEGADRYVPHDPTTGEPWPDWSSTVRESAGVLRDCATGIFVENRGVFSRGRETLAAATRPNLIGSLVGYTFEVVGIGAAIENMWIAATSLGVHGAFMGDIVIADAMIRTRLSIECDLMGVLALGYPEPGIGPQQVTLDVHDSRQVAWY